MSEQNKEELLKSIDCMLARLRAEVESHGRMLKLQLGLPVEETGTVGISFEPSIKFDQAPSELILDKVPLGMYYARGNFTGTVIEVVGVTDNAITLEFNDGTNVIRENISVGLFCAIFAQLNA